MEEKPLARRANKEERAEAAAAIGDHRPTGHGCEVGYRQADEATQDHAAYDRGPQTTPIQTRSAHGSSRWMPIRRTLPPPEMCA